MPAPGAGGLGGPGERPVRRWLPSARLRAAIPAAPSSVPSLLSSQLVA